MVIPHRSGGIGGRKEVPEGAGWERKRACLVVGHAQESDKCLMVILTLKGKN